MRITIAVALAVSVVAAAGIGFAASHKNHGTMMSPEEYEFQPIREGSPVGVVVLWGDPATGPSGRLLRLPAGFVAPTHAHTADYHATNMTGMWKHKFMETGEERTLAPGSYVFQPGGEMHGDACMGPVDCIIYLEQPGPGDFIPQE